MLESYRQANILLVSASATFEDQLQALFEKHGLDNGIFVTSIDAGKRILIDSDIDLVILDAPLPAEDVTRFAMELSKSKSFDYSIIMLVGETAYGKHLYQAERMGIVTLKKPLDPHLLLQTMRLLLSMRMKIKKLESKADQFKQRLEDDRLISRAKILLVSNLGMSENDAHHYIEKKAMDECIKKTIVATQVISLYSKKT